MKTKIFDKRYYSSGWYTAYLKNYKKEGLIYAKRLISILKPKKSWKFLDVGCGMGGIVLALRKMGYEAFGTEISPFCLQNSPAKKWIFCCDILKLPFEKESFEVVLSIDVLEYLKKNLAKLAIKKLAKITKIFLYLETITKFSPNASQKLNPDSKREKSLLTAGEIIIEADF
ncbi:class I SAM-dependent methyltransferase [Candidatus Parcubacteria bacterium]|nr:class I SAM-dependent methyltransferase [Candidatus Parcubacteria bacterium]